MKTSPGSPAREASIKVWDLPLRLFHWLLVVAIAMAFLSSEEESALAPWHVPVGWGIAVLLVFRLAWGVVGGEHARFGQFVRPSEIGSHVAGLLRGHPEPTLGHNALGALSVILLLGLVAATVWSGAVGADEEIHEAIAYAMLALVAVHLTAVIVMSILTRDGLVRAMITGRKRRERHPGTHDARSASLAALALAILAAAAAVAAILAYDSRAFQPQLHSSEHSGEAGAERED